MSLILLHIVGLLLVHSVPCCPVIMTNKDDDEYENEYEYEKCRW